MNTIEILKKINQIESILVNIKEDLNSKGNNNTGLNKLSNKPKLYPKSNKLIERLPDLNTNQKTEAFLSSLIHFCSFSNLFFLLDSFSRINQNNILAPLLPTFPGKLALC